jgi:hypothetical protein
VFPVRYELGIYIPEADILHSHRRQNLKFTSGYFEDGILHSHCRENLKSYIALTGWTSKQRRNVFPVRYELGIYIPEADILHSHRRENFKLISGYFETRHNIFRGFLNHMEFLKKYLS